MKYRICNANNKEAYELGYMLGSKQITVRDFQVIDWDDDQKSFSRGYNAGAQRYFQNRKRNNTNKRTKSEQKR